MIESCRAEPRTPIPVYCKVRRRFARASHFRETEPQKSDWGTAMGWRFQRRIKLIPGVTLNLSKGGVSASLGIRGAHLTLGRGRVRTTVGVPGTGISYTDIESTRAPGDSDQQQPMSRAATRVAPYAQAGAQGGAQGPSVSPLAVIGLVILVVVLVGLVAH